MAEYSKKLIPVPTINLFREQDAGKQPVLDVRNLGIDFGGLTAVDEFSMTIGPTEISGLIGPNGAGKTTIFNLLTSVYQPTRGSILVKGIDTKGMDTAKVNKLGVARTFQNIRLFGDMTALDNVKVGMHNEIKCSFLESVFRLPGYFKAEKKANANADKEKIAELEDKVKRQLAEFENFRNRTEKEKQAMFETGAKSVIEKILPVIDNFERGLASIESDNKDSFYEGMCMIHKQMLSELEKIGVTPIEALGKEFDPNFHNAVMQVESEEFESGIVAQELQKGYMYRDAVVRYSMVAVVS